MKFAENTTVSVEASEAEIKRTLIRYGASSFMSGWKKSGVAVIGFEMKGHRVKFILPLPSPDEDEYTYTPARKTKRSPAQAMLAWEKACRQRWRALALVIKAKLEAVETGITEFEEEFLAHIVLPNGSTVGEFMIPQVTQAYETKAMPPLLPDLRGS